MNTIRLHLNKISGMSKCTCFLHEITFLVKKVLKELTVSSLWGLMYLLEHNYANVCYF